MGVFHCQCPGTGWNLLLGLVLNETMRADATTVKNAVTGRQELCSTGWFHWSLAWQTTLHPGCNHHRQFQPVGPVRCLPRPGLVLLLSKLDWCPCFSKKATSSASFGGILSFSPKPTIPLFCHRVTL